MSLKSGSHQPLHGKSAQRLISLSEGGREFKGIDRNAP
jgi:hypothetical protein